MSAVVEFTVYGKPEAQGSVKAFMPKGWTRPVLTSTNKNLKGWRHVVASEAQLHAGAPVPRGRPVRLHVSFVLERPKSLPRKVQAHTKKPDLDKLVRAIKDALTGVLYADDSQVTVIEASKAYGAVPCVRIRVEDLEALGQMVQPETGHVVAVAGLFAGAGV